MQYRNIFIDYNHRPFFFVSLPFNIALEWVMTYEENDSGGKTEGGRPLSGDRPPRGSGGNAGVSTPEWLMGHQPATEDPGFRLKTRRPVETTAGMLVSRIFRLVTHLNQSLGQCPSGKRTSARCCVPGVGSGNGGEPLTGADYTDLEGGRQEP